MKYRIVRDTTTNRFLIQKKFFFFPWIGLHENYFDESDSIISNLVPTKDNFDSFNEAMQYLESYTTKKEKHEYEVLHVQ